MTSRLSRREFLGLGGLAGCSLAFNPLHTLLPPEDQVKPMGVGRVTVSAIKIYREPSFKSEHIGWRRRDQLVDLFEEINAPEGTYWSPRWYRVIGGYAHSGYLQRVENAHLNQPLAIIPDGGQLAEVSVPFAQSYRDLRSAGWKPLYRLYYESVHWITEIKEGPDSKPWYGILDEKLHVLHYTPAVYLRPIPPEELAPISPKVPAEEKRIIVSTDEQTATAYEGDKVVLHVPISSGVASRRPASSKIPTDTPVGTYHISMKLPSRHMGDGNLTSDLNAYELPGVPWVNFYSAIGIGFHGTYWHDNFGYPMSHGCINMRNQDAKWLYRWTTPEVSHRDWYKPGWGTLVQVF
jgi:lipoprotein-anchoring transpeptidase ErfK/SrfK